MTLERLAGSAFVGLLGASAASALATRRSERRRRAAAMTGNTLVDVADGVVECRVLRARDTTADLPIIVCENGLGAPLECWDWVADRLADHADVVLYHRRGYGATTSSLPPAALIEAVVRSRLADRDDRLVVVAHSIGGTVTRGALADSTWLREHVEGVCLVDSTDPALLREVAAIPERRGKLTQALLLERIGAWLGTTAVRNPILEEIDHRASDQQRFARFTADPATVATAGKELRENLARADDLVGTPLPRAVVVSAERSHEGGPAHARTQAALAAALDAPHVTVAGSAHRSILGFRRHGVTVADHVLTWLGAGSTAAPTPDDVDREEVPA